MLERNSIGKLVSSGMLLAAMSLTQAAALAQASGGTESADGKTVSEALVERRLRSTTARGGQPESSVSMFVYSDGNKTLKLRNGKVESIVVDGKELPVDRASADGDDVVVKDEKGVEITRFAGAGQQFGGGAAGAPNIRLRALADRDTAQRGRDLSFRTLRPMDRAGQGLREEIAKPKVMLGISMAKPSAELAGHFGIKAANVTLVNFVHKGTPAAEAGLQQFDLLTRVKLGVADEAATPEKIRELMRDANPGDEVEFKVLQRGAEKTLKLKLVAFDETKLADGPAFEGIPGDGAGFGHGGIAGLGALGGAGNGNVIQFRQGDGALMPMPGEPGVAALPRNFNDQDALRHFGQAFEGMGDQFKERFKANGGNPFIVIEPRAEADGGGDPQLHELISRLEERMVQLEQALRDLKGAGGADKAPAGDAKDAGPKKEKKQGASRGPATGNRVFSIDSSRLMIGMPQADAI
jgi:hypothetical protein